jgi:hypothetical protein
MNHEMRLSMKLIQGIAKPGQWLAKGSAAQFDIEAVRARTVADRVAPFRCWNFPRFPGHRAHKLLNQGLCDRGIIVGKL